MYKTPVILCAAIFALYATLSPYLSVLTRSLGFNPEEAGLILGALEIAGIGAPLLLGALSDKLGNYKTTLILALFCSAASSFAIFILKTPVVCVFFALILAAALRSAVPLQDAIVTLNLKQQSNYGFIRASGSISFVLVVIFLQYTPFFRPYNARNIAFWAFVVSVLVLALLFCLPRSYFLRSRKPQVGAGNSNTGGTRKIWTLTFAFGMLLIFLNRLAFSPIQTYIALYTIEYLKWDAVGILAAVSAAAETPFVFLSGHLIKRFGETRLIAVTTGAVLVRLLLIALFPVRGVLFASQFLHALTFGVFHPAAVAFVSMNVPPEKRAVGMAIYISLGTGLPSLIGNILGGFVIGFWGYRALFALFSIFAFLALVLYTMRTVALKRSMA